MQSKMLRIIFKGTWQGFIGTTLVILCSIILVAPTLLVLYWTNSGAYSFIVAIFYMGTLVGITQEATNAE